MKLIAITEDKFEKEFKMLLLKLSLDTLKEDNGQYNNPIASPKLVYEHLHLKFNYELHQFKKALENA